METQNQNSNQLTALLENQLKTLINKVEYLKMNNYLNQLEIIEIENLIGQTKSKDIFTLMNLTSQLKSIQLDKVFSQFYRAFSSEYFSNDDFMPAKEDKVEGEDFQEVNQFKINSNIDEMTASKDTKYEFIVQEPNSIVDNIDTLPGVVDAKISQNQAAILTEDRNLIIQGMFNGQRNPPIASIVKNKVQKVACGINHILILTIDGYIWGQGDNKFGQIHIPKITEKCIDVGAGQNHSVILTEKRNLICLGNNRFGTLNFDSKLQGHVEKIHCKYDNLFIVTKDHKLQAQGYNKNGECNIPDSVQGLVQDVKFGYQYTAVLSIDQKVHIFGKFDKRYLFKNLTNVTSIYADNNCLIAVCSNSKIVCSNSSMRTQGVCKFELQYEVNDRKLQALGFKDRNELVVERNLEWQQVTYTKYINFLLESHKISSNHINFNKIILEFSNFSFYHQQLYSIESVLRIILEVYEEKCSTTTNYELKDGKPIAGPIVNNENSNSIITNVNEIKGVENDINVNKTTKQNNSNVKNQDVKSLDSLINSTSFSENKGNVFSNVSDHKNEMKIRTKEFSGNGVDKAESDNIRLISTNGNTVENSNENV